MNLAGRRVFASFSLRVIKLSWKTWDLFHLLGWTPGTLQNAVVYFWHVLEQWVKTPFHFGWQYICCQVCNEGTCKTRRPRPNSFIDFRTKIWFSAKKTHAYSRGFLFGKGPVAYLGTCTKSSLPEAWRSDQRTSMRPFQTCPCTAKELTWCAHNRATMYNHVQPLS